MKDLGARSDGGGVPVVSGDSPRRLDVANPYSSAVQVEVVIVNYRRPGNLPLIIEGFRQQTEPCRITICEVAKGAERLPREVREMADAVIDLTDNVGGFNRYVAVNAFRLPYTWFHDDDMVPGPRMIEGFLRYTWLAYGVLGQIGRRVKKSGFAEVKAKAEPVAVDFLVRGYWVQTRDLPMIQRFLWKAWELGTDPGLREDDILLVKGIEAFTGRGAIVVPALPDGKMNQRNLPEPHAQAVHPDHKAGRLRYVHFTNSIFQTMHSEPRRIVLAGCPSSGRKNLAEHLRAAGAVAWLRRRFPEAEILTLCEGEEEVLGELALSERDLVVGFDKDTATWSALYAGVPRMILPSAGLAGEGNGASGNPDLALFLDREFTPPVYDRDGLLLGLAHASAQEEAKLVQEASGLGLSLQTMTKVDSRTPVRAGIQSWLFRRKVAEFASVSAVVTNSLDYLAFAILARTPCVLVAGHEASGHPLPWLARVSAVRVVRDSSCLQTELELALKGSYRDLPDLRHLIEQALEPLAGEFLPEQSS